MLRIVWNVEKIEKIEKKNFALKWPHAEKNLAEFSQKKISPKISESTKNGLKREINRKNRFFFLALKWSHAEKKQPNFRPKDIYAKNLRID